MKRFLSIFTVLFLSLSVVSSSGMAAMETSATFTILHFNDFHAQVLPFKKDFNDRETNAGIARLVYEIKKHKKQNTLLMVGGDILQGTPFSTIFKGEESFSMLNHLIDYMVLGNHEFDYGQENLQKLIKMSRFKIFSSNVIYQNGAPYFRETHFIHKMNGIKLGIFGLTTQETYITTHPKNVQGLKFLDEIPTARKMVSQLKQQGAKIIIALNHIGYRNDIALARAVPGIDVIVGGHSHTLLENGVRINQTLITQAYAYGLYLGVIKLVVSLRTGKLLQSHASVVKITPRTPEDSETLKMVKYYNARLDGSLNRVIGETQVFLDGNRETVRVRESNLGNLIADVIKNASRAEIAFMNGGGIRAAIQKGKITVGDVIKVLPFNNTIYTMRITGAALLNVLKKSAGKAHDDGGFLQVSGGLVIKLKNNRLVSVLFNRQPIVPSRYYTVAVSDFLAAGGDGYSEFQNGLNTTPTGITLSDALINFITKTSRVHPVLEGRIVRE